MAQRQIDHYHLLEEIAAGGQATVHKAWDTRTGQIVALKVMHPHLAKDADYLERFHREARLAAEAEAAKVAEAEAAAKAKAEAAEKEAKGAEAAEETTDTPADGDS